MPRGYRCILVAFVGWLSLAQPEHATAKPTGSPNHEIANALNNVAAAIQKPQEPSKHDEPCDAGENKRTSDLCAQWKAADAAKSTAQAAWWLGLLGSVIGAATLAAAWAAARWAKKAAIHTEESATEAARAANVAEDALEFDRSNAHAANRPWLSVERVDIGNVKDDGSGSPAAGGIYFQFLLKNFGHRPATEIYLLADVLVTPPDGVCPDIAEPVVEDHHGIAGPGGLTASGPRGVSLADSEAWKRGERHLWFSGFARYGEPGIPDRPYGMTVLFQLTYAGMAVNSQGEPLPHFHARAVGNKSRLT